MSNFFKASSLALFLALLSPLAAAAQTELCGTFTLELNDTYGDGWNGNELDLSFTGGDSTYTFTSGYQATYSLTVPTLLILPSEPILG